MKRKKQGHKAARPEVSPVTILTDELDAVRRDLRRTIRAYAVRLELDLAESIAAVTRYKRAEELSRERLHDIRDLTILMRKRKLKPYSYDRARDDSTISLSKIVSEFMSRLVQLNVIRAGNDHHNDAAVFALLDRTPELRSFRPQLADRRVNIVAH